MKPKTITLTKERLIELKDFQFSKGYRSAKAEEQERILKMIEEFFEIQIKYLNNKLKTVKSDKRKKSYIEQMKRLKWNKENLKSEIKGD